MAKNKGQSQSEHLALESSLSLFDFCSRFQKVIDLPPFQYDSENRTEWGWVEVSGLEYNISRPYTQGTLHEWDESVPIQCTFGISLIVKDGDVFLSNMDWLEEKKVRFVAQAMANEFKTTVYHHRTWSRPGKNTYRSQQYYPEMA